MEMQMMTNKRFRDEDFFMYAEDDDWCKRIGMAGWRVVYYPGPKAIHFGRVSSSREPTRFYREKQKSSLHYWKKHHGKSSVVCYAAIIFLHNFLRLNIWMIPYIILPRERKKALNQIEKYLSSVKWLLRSRNHKILYKSD